MEQVANDRELSVEIIDLFLSEEPSQIAEMQRALAARDYNSLYVTAHTIKGSLGSLHAALARFHAEALESAAKKQDEPGCERSLSDLKHDLETLEPQLLNLRDSNRA